MPEIDPSAPPESILEPQRNAAARILIVDDDPQVQIALEDLLEQQGHDVTLACDGAAALDLMRQQSFDLVLLDVMLPKKNGFEVLQEAQDFPITSPVLMISANGSQQDILRGLGLGAQDYLVKPFDAEDLLGRMEPFLAPPAPSEAPLQTFSFGDIEVNFVTRTAEHSGKGLALGEVEFDLLRFLVRHRGKVVSRKRLLREVWGIDEESMAFEVATETVARTVDQHIQQLRAKLEPNPFEPTFIETVYGQGYRFTSEA